MSIPFLATHTADDGRYYMVDECEWFYANHLGIWRRHWSGVPAGLKAISPKQPQAWSGPEDGLPPAGLTVELWRDGIHGQHVEIVGHFQAANKVAAYVPIEGARVVNQAIAGCFQPIRTKDQLRESAIRDVMDIAQVDCRVTAARLVDAGFKREMV